MDRFRLHHDSTVNLSDFENSHLQDASTAQDCVGEGKIVGKSIKEIEDQLNFLRKENFDLKLRIYFLEENISPGFDIQETVKANVNLKLEVEGLKNVLEATEESNQHERIEHSKIKREMEKRVSELERQLNNQDNSEEFKSVVTKQADQLTEYETDVGHFLIKIEEYSLIISTLNAKIENYEIEMKQKDEQIAKLKKYEAEVGIRGEQIAKLKKAEMDLKYKVEKCKKEIMDKDERIMVLEFSAKNSLSEASVNSSGRSPLKSLSPPNVCDVTKLDKLEKEKMKAAKVIQTLLEATKKDRAEIEDLKRKVKVKNDEIEKLKRMKEICDTSRRSSINDSINASNCGEHVELLEQYKDLTKELDSQKEILLQTLKEKDLQMSTLEHNYSAVLNDLKTGEKRIKELESELLGKENREKCDYGSEKNRGALKKQDEFLSLICEKDAEIARLKKIHEKEVESSKISVDRKKLLLHVEELKEKLAQSDENLRKSESLRSETNEVCLSLSAHLEELAMFLDSLLKQKSVLGFLGNNRNNRLKQIVNHSLDLSKSLNMSLSMNPDQSLMQLTNISELLDSFRADPSLCLGDEKFNNCSQLSFTNGRQAVETSKVLEAHHVAALENIDEDLLEAQSGDQNAEAIPNKSFLNKSTQSALDVVKSSLNKSTQFQNNIKEENTEAANSNETLIAKLAHLNDELKVKEDQLISLQEQKDDLTEQLNELMTKYESEQELYKELIKNEVSVTKRIGEFEKRLSKTEREKLIADENNDILQQQISVLGDLVEELEQNKSKLSDTVEENLKIIQSLECELSETLEGKEIVEEELMLTQERARSAEEKLDDFENALLELEESKKEAEVEFAKAKEEFANEIKAMTTKFESLEEKEINLRHQLEESESDYLEQINGLRKHLDEAVAHYSELLREKNTLEDHNSQLESELSAHIEKAEDFLKQISNLKEMLQNSDYICKKCENNPEKQNFDFNEFANLRENSLQFNKVTNNDVEGANSSELPSGANSPDLGIGSDRGRLSSLDVNGEESMSLNKNDKVCCDKAQENIELKKKLERSGRLLRESYKQLLLHKEKKREVERSICNQLSKTNEVLQKVKGHMSTDTVKEEGK